LEILNILSELSVSDNRADLPIILALLNFRYVE
jgi:hypothetical protein